MIERHADLDPQGPWWDLYSSTFYEIDTMAAQRHMLTFDEFRDIAIDQRLHKHVALSDRGGGQRRDGLAVITNRLEAWPLISPRYFARRWPVHYDERRIFYIGFVCAHPDAPRGTFRDLITDMSERVFAVDGIAVMDWSTANVNKGLPRATTWLLNSLHPKTAGEEIDAQRFYAYRFDGEKP